MAKRSVIVVVLFIGLVGIWIGGCETQEQKVERLITELGHKETKDRKNAARALGSIGEGAVDAVPALIQLLQDQDEDPRVRLKAEWALGKTGVPEAIKAVEYAVQRRKAKKLIKELQDQNPEVRANALHKLVEIGEDAVPALIQALQDQDSNVRNNAARALGSIGEGAVDAVPALIQLLKDQDEWVRINAAWALEEIKKFLPEATDGEDFDF